MENDECYSKNEQKAVQKQSSAKRQQKLLDANDEGKKTIEQPNRATWETHRWWKDDLSGGFVVVIVFTTRLSVMAYLFSVHFDSCIWNSLASSIYTDLRLYLCRIEWDFVCGCEWTFVRSSCILWHSAEYNYRLWKRTVRMSSNEQRMDYMDAIVYVCVFTFVFLFFIFIFHVLSLCEQRIERIIIQLHRK